VTDLLLGCGSNRDKRLVWGGKKGWSDLVTLDFNADHKPDVVWDLNTRPLPFPDDHFDEIHAYEVLEHLGSGPGDWESFFAEFSEWYRLLKPNGFLFATSPAPGSPWVWGDPSHRRAMSVECLIYLHQPAYTKQVGVTPMSDFRFCFKGDFNGRHLRVNEGSFEYVLQAVKPSRIEVK
jgi:SAM-dependent methyltransferase